MKREANILKDKNGVEIPVESILFGAVPDIEGEHYFNFYRNGDSYEMIACTYGYVHDVNQKHVENLQLIGSSVDNLHLLSCD